MKKLSLFLGLCGSLHFAMSANALVGSAHIQFYGLLAFSTWGSFSPLDTEGNSFLPEYNKDCDALYGKLKKSNAFVQYNIDDYTGHMTGTVNYLGTSFSFDGGKWETNLPRFGLKNGDWVDGSKWSLSQTFVSNLPDLFKTINTDAIKVQFVKLNPVTKSWPAITLSLMFPLENSLVPTQCFLWSKLILKKETPPVFNPPNFIS